ncbi:GNAT family N-acetyltransferase [Butyrivibrio proteoclasticus]|uniref:GNAT family N-acetyltransferase n=1 Tax=Butyrivibrio proteoclasticus TaxID=43305 RepID=UPI00047DB6C9|nr:GNAT family N-acetyltransferase [Butyrivibrio proteoclasticus]
MNNKRMFDTLHPGFLEPEHLSQISSGQDYDEMVLFLKDYEENKKLYNPENIEYDYYKGDFDAFLTAVRKVDESWADIYKPSDRIYCGFYKGEVVSFCLIEDMGIYEEGGISYKVGGPGCVGTIPDFRKKGIGLKMIDKATCILKDLSYDISYVHYTGVASWYSKLGYRTILRWNKEGKWESIGD